MKTLNLRDPMTSNRGRTPTLHHGSSDSTKIDAIPPVEHCEE